MSYHPPGNIMEILQKLEFEEALAADDPRFVDTMAARGSQKTLDRLARKFGLLLNDGQFYPPMQKHVLFFGHVGSGKTTELRHYATALNGPERFLVVEVDITVELDRNNLKYADTLMAMARALLACLDERGIDIDAAALKDMQRWFSERVLSSDDVREFAADVKIGSELKWDIPALVKLFGSFTASFKTNRTYKESLRQIIRNSFTELATAFNELLTAVEQTIKDRHIAQRVLFIIDGTDKLRGEDTREFFVHDAEQLLAIAGLVVYAAPLSLKYESNLIGRLDADLVLPMIKLYERDGNLWEPGWEALRKLLLLRADSPIFADDACIDLLVEHCGGHPRELLRLLKLCCEFAEDNSIDPAVADRAIDQLAAEYRRFLEPEDYILLAELDGNRIHAGNDERTRKLLYNLALLEYNDGSWRRSHPAIRRLEGYTRAVAAI